MTMASSGTLLGVQGPLWSVPWMQVGSRRQPFAYGVRFDACDLYCFHIVTHEMVLQINPRSPDFRHKITRKALWVDGWSTPVWVKAMLQGELQPHVDHHTHNPQDTAWSNRSLKKNNGGGSSQSTYARESRQHIQVDDARMPMQSAITLSEAIAVLNNHIQEGIIVDSHTYVAVLQRCFRQKDFTSAKQVHDCITRSGMEQNIYVANNMMRVYIRCGKLQEALTRSVC